MIWLMLGLLIVILLSIIICMAKNMDLSEPVFLLVAGYLLATIFVILNYERWNVEEFGSKTVGVVIIGILSWLLGAIGCKFAYGLFSKRRTIHKKEKRTSSEIVINKKSIILTFFFTILTAVIYLTDLIRRSGIGYSGLIKFMTMIRPLLKNNEISISFISIQLFSFCRAMAYVFTFAFLWNIIKVKKKNMIYMVVPVAYLAMSLFTSGRIYLIYYLIYSVTLYFILSKSNNSYSLKNLIIYTFRTIILITIALAIFAALANIVGRNTEHTIFEQISIYVGGPLVSFDKFIKKYNYQTSSYFGEETLTGVYQILEKIGLTKIKPNRHLEFVQFGNNWGNVYSAQRRYIADYGLNNSFFLMMIISYLYTFFHEKIVRNKKKNVSFCLYAMLAYPIPMMVIDDVLLSSVISINTIYDIIYVLIVYYILVDRKIKICI